MTKEVFVFPLTTSAVRWLEDHVAELQTAFMEIHRNHSETDTEHPHRLGVMVREPGSTEFSPEEPPVYIYIPAHWDSNHMGSTARDIGRVLRQLGASLTDFEIEASE